MVQPDRHTYTAVSNTTMLLCTETSTVRRGCRVLYNHEYMECNHSWTNIISFICNVLCYFSLIILKQALVYPDPGLNTNHLAHIQTHVHCTTPYLWHHSLPLFDEVEKWFTMYLVYWLHLPCVFALIQCISVTHNVTDIISIPFQTAKRF